MRMRSASLQSLTFSPLGAFLNPCSNSTCKTRMPTEYEPMEFRRCETRGSMDGVPGSLMRDAEGLSDEGTPDARKVDGEKMAR